jgi:hypothetical protein
MNIHFLKADLEYLLSPLSIRERTKVIFDYSLAGKTNFQVNLDKLNMASDYVYQVIREKYPDLKIPFHSRHQHINAGGVDRLIDLEKVYAGADKREIARTKFDLVVVSVLLDAGAGEEWKYQEKNGKAYDRSEGLAVASFHMFKAGAFSSYPKNPFRADVEGLKKLTEDQLKEHFQVTDKNPLIGVPGRVGLLNNLARVMEANPTVFKHKRIGDLLDYLTDEYGVHLQAAHVLKSVLKFFGDVWPSRIRLGTQNLGDVWNYPPFGPANSVKSFVPFHKLSQWLSYSLLVPMIDLGIKVSGVDELTGLAEYRNGGLMIDLGLLEARDPKILEQKHAPESEVVIEWRALTVVLLDMIAENIRSKLNMTKEELPLAKILEGGTWHAGRKIAKEKRPSGEPPLNIISDGTVF